MGKEGNHKDSLRALLTLSMMEHLGYRTLLKLLKVYRDPVRVCKIARSRSPKTDGAAFFGVDEKSLKRAWTVIENKDVRVIDYNEPHYPETLKHLYDPPPILFVRGNLSLLERTSIAIVGTRGATGYGLRVAGWLGAAMAREGLPVVSGMARGIDTEAHRSCLDAGGETVAVLGTGIDVPYPAGNRKLMERIVETGCVVSEFPPGMPGLKQNFPRRNRIISGLSVGTVVVEAPERSGALITAEFAIDQGKPVFAVPGDIWSKNSLGPHALIRDGAIPVFSEADILDAIGWKRKPVQKGGRASGAERPILSTTSARIIDSLDRAPVHIDDLSSRCSLTPSETLDELLKLEMRGLVEQRPGKYFLLR